MMRFVERDERERGADLAADRLAYLFLSYGLLLIVAWRAFTHGEASWDLLALVVLGGFVSLAYRVGSRAITGRWVGVVVATVVIGLVAAALLAVLSR